MNYQQTITEHARLSILKLLATSPAYEASQHLLYVALPSEGVNLSADQVAAMLDWLRDMDMVTIKDLAGVRLARISGRGLDVAAGKILATGIARPLPE